MFRHQFSYYYFSFVVLLVLGALLFLPAMVSGDEQEHRYAPGNHVRADQIRVYEDRVVLDVENTQWAMFEDTDSMLPFFDEYSHALQMRPERPDQVAPGDIITYRDGDKTIIHRVVNRGIDKEGTYYEVKGDNNAQTDPLKLRFEDVETVVYGIIY